MKKVKGIILSFLIAIVSICIMPFSVHANDIYVEDWGIDNIIGVNLINLSSNYDPTGDNYFNAIFRVVFDDHYIGKMRITIKYRLSGNSNLYTISKDIAFNGGYVDVYEYSGPKVIRNDVGYEPYVSSVTAIGKIYKYSDFVNIFPYESMNFILDIVDRNFEIVDFYHLGSYMYPIFKINSGDEIISRYLQGNVDQPNNKYITVMWVNANMNNVSTFNNVFTLQNCAVTDIVTLNTFAYQGASTRIIKFTIYNNTGSTGTCRLKANQDMYIMPIYNKRLGEIGYETQDFCDNFGLPYSGLTSEEQQSVDDLDDVTADFSQTSSDVINVEDTVGSGFTDALQNVPTTFNFSTGFGASFITSAQWVRDQFNYFTVNTPFGSLISFSLILGLALLLLGRKLL